MKKIKSVAVMGGTHGNEFTGIYLIKKIQMAAGHINKYNFNLEPVIANQKAYDSNRRYIDRDLNRSFKTKDLENEGLDGYENILARQLNKKIGPKGNSKTDLIIDLHTSTAPMGINLVLTKIDSFHLKLVDYVQQRISGVTITLEDLADHHFLMSMAPNNVLIEVGPSPQSLLRQDIFDKTEETLNTILEYVQLFNAGKLPAHSDAVDLYKYFDVIYLPQDENGKVVGMVHENIQDRDFTTLKPGEPIFKLFDGSTICYEGKDDATISFINEAAYYDEKKAFSLSHKKTIPIRE